MGSLGDDGSGFNPIDKNPTPNLSDSDDDTQLFDDSHFSPFALSGETHEAGDADELQLLQSTMPFFETAPFEDGDTQLMNLAGETQVFEDGDWVGNMDRDDGIGLSSDSEGSDKTVVLCDTQCLSDDDSAECSSAQTDENMKVRSGGKQREEESIAESDAVTDKQHAQGSVLKGFTSVRTASLRASGLAARNMASKETGGGSCSIQCLSLYPCQQVLEEHGTAASEDLNKRGTEVDHSSDKSNYGANKSRVSSSAVRKLFADDAFEKNIQIAGDIANADGETVLAGLSYVNSQEPGESSQADALDFVDRLVKCSDVGSLVNGSPRKTIKKQPDPVSSAKGPQSLAKTAIFISKIGKQGVFDWDDNREDEGGGEFFSKRKDVFFDGKSTGRKCLTESRKSRGTNLKGSRVINEEEHANIQSGKLDAIHSDSKLLLVNSKEMRKTAKAAEGGVRKNLINDLNEQENVDSSGAQAENAGKEVDMAGTLNVGFDTQMAAEAIEALSSGVACVNQDSRGAHQVCLDSNEISLPNRALGACMRQNKQRKRANTDSKKDSSSPALKRSRSSKTKMDEEQGSKLKRARLSTEDSVLDGLRLKLIEQRNIRCSKRRQAPLEGPISGGKQCWQEEVVTYSSPIACRTRQRILTDQLRTYKDNLSEFGKKNNLGEFAASKGKRKRSKETNIAKLSNGNDDSFKLVVTQSAVDKVDLSPDKEQGVKFAALGSSIGKVALNHPRGKRTNRTCGKLNQACNIDGPFEQSVIRLEASPGQISRSSHSTCTTPINCRTPVSEASPICMGNEYLKGSCQKNLSKSFLMKEISELTASPEPVSALNYLRKRREISNVQVLFSRHLNEDIIKQQKKILARLGASIASSMSDATHFVADEFTRTRNMLEAIAFGKPVVTHLWLESCGQASCFIDEKGYILRDSKKEKEVGFSMPISLARSCKQPLLEGQRVYITPNTKPSKEIIASLVKAVHGKTVNKVGGSALKNEKIPEDLLVLSCEEDYAICEPFLVKGVPVYSSELLLNGIVIQKLEYARHRLFEDKVKRTRSTVWLQKDGNHFLPVTRKD